MCRSKEQGGQRCAGYAEGQMSAALSEYRTCLDGYHTKDELEAAKTRMQAALVVYATTTEGQNYLGTQAAANPDQADTLASIMNEGARRRAEAAAIYRAWTAEQKPLPVASNASELTAILRNPRSHGVDIAYCDTANAPDIDVDRPFTVNIRDGVKLGRVAGTPENPVTLTIHGGDVQHIHNAAVRATGATIHNIADSEIIRADTDTTIKNAGYGTHIHDLHESSVERMIGDAVLDRATASRLGIAGDDVTVRRAVNTSIETVTGNAVVEEAMDNTSIRNLRGSARVLALTDSKITEATEDSGIALIAGESTVNRIQGDVWIGNFDSGRIVNIERGIEPDRVGADAEFVDPGEYTHV